VSQMNLALIIGAMKSGTTSLLAYLSSHPAVVRSPMKEPNFFTDDDLWARGEQWYRDLFQWDPSRHRWAVEASTSYTKPGTSEIAAERIASFPGEKRLIFIMRNPIDRLRSHLAHGKALGWRSFAGSEIPDKVLRTSKYAEQLRPYSTHFPRADLLLLLFEDLVADPATLMGRVYAHLELEPSAVDLARAHNVTSERLVRPDWYNRIRGMKGVSALRSLLPARTWLARRVLRFQPAEHVQFEPEQRERLIEMLAPDLRALRRDFQVDISRWNLGV
jgi:hypothetical protein